MKVVYVVGKKWPEMVIKWPFVSTDFNFFFLTELKKIDMTKIVFDIVVFDQIRI